MRAGERHELRRAEGLRGGPFGLRPVVAIGSRVIGALRRRTHQEARGDQQHPGGEARQVYQPRGIAISRRGDLYVADTGNSRIQVVAPNGKPCRQFDSRGTKPGQFVNPQAVTVDWKGFVYVSDTGNDRIQKFSPVHH